uniref:Thioredoxin s1 n=1 Tax=Medicago truncatula TaxID=3880 RepID=A9RAA5_MEDTR|nr:thioredoxin s1 [Medicago truncatula]
MTTVTITMSSFIFIILFHTLSASMATAQLLNAATQDASNGVAYVTDENFGSLVLNSETLVLVEFFAPLCSPCKNVDFKIVELANEYAGEVEFFKLNVDDNQLIPSKYGIKGIPNVLIFKNGEQRDTLFGNLPKATFIKRMEQNL